MADSAAPAPMVAWSETPPHETKTVSEPVRMRLNGETRAVIEHARAVKATEADFSVDQPWSADRRLGVTDLYMLAVSCAWLLPKALAFYPALMLAQLPVVLLLAARARALPPRTRELRRTSCSFRLFAALVAVVALPTLLLALLSYLLDLAAYYTFSVLYCTLACNWRGYCRSQRALRPYRGGPSMLLAAGDVLVALLGAVHRQGPLEYFVNANPFLYPLEERFVQQISTSMQDLTEEQITCATERVVSDLKPNDELTRKVDSWWFLPHYPLPPPWKRWAVGVQCAGCDRSGLFFLFTHSLHAACGHGGSYEQLVLSSSAVRPWKRVMLWYNNPYHFFTGWVEAQISSGLPSQPDKCRGGEHPMWIVSCRSPWHCRRKAPLTVGYIDAVFDQWLPILVYALRRTHRGDSAAEELREDVVSKDGLSRPACAKQVPFVPAKALAKCQTPH